MNVFPVILEILLANYELYGGKKANYEEILELDMLASMIDDPVRCVFAEWNEFDLISKSLTPTGAELCMTHLDSRQEECAGVYWLEEGYYLICFHKNPGSRNKIRIELLSYYKAPDDPPGLAGFSDLFDVEFQIIYADVFS